MSSERAGQSAMSKEREAPDVDLNPNERLDDLGIGGLFIIQDTESFCFGMDAVLLSSFAKVRPKESVLDLCAGNGILPLLLSAKTEAGHITGVELFHEAAELAKRSVRLNGLEDRISIVQGDARSAGSVLLSIQKSASTSEDGRIDVITCNPPYMKGGLLNEKENITAARHEITLSLPEVVKTASELLVPKGRVYFVHRPYRLAELFYEMHRAGVEPKTLRLVAPYKGKSPNLALVEGVKGAKPFLTVEPELVVYEKPDVYTKEVLEIYGML